MQRIVQMTAGGATVVNGRKVESTFSRNRREQLTLGLAGNGADKLRQKSKQKARITVTVRKRPVSPAEFQRSDPDVIPTPSRVHVLVEEPRKNVQGQPYIESHQFKFDRVYDEKCSNLQVYDSCVRSLVSAVFEEGGRCSCFCYGQTGSGKTYTMIGPRKGAKLGLNNLNNDEKGLMDWAATDLIDFINRPKWKAFGLFVSFFEIYCNKVYDLLNERKPVRALESKTADGVVVKDLVVQRAHTEKELISVMECGLAERIVGKNSRNSDSSRGHAIMTIEVKHLEQQSTHGKLAFIDLAGSERGADTLQSNRPTQQDGAGINRSLLALKECIRAMDQGQSHIPFRDSELTKVLRDLFICDTALTLMIANISPTASCCEQTLNTLRYADRVFQMRQHSKPCIAENLNESEEGRSADVASSAELVSGPYATSSDEASAVSVRDGFSGDEVDTMKRRESFPNGCPLSDDEKLSDVEESAAESFASSIDVHSSPLTQARRNPAAPNQNVSSHRPPSATPPSRRREVPLKKREVPGLIAADGLSRGSLAVSQISSATGTVSSRPTGGLSPRVSRLGPTRTSQPHDPSASSQLPPATERPITSSALAASTGAMGTKASKVTSNRLTQKNPSKAPAAPCRVDPRTDAYVARADGRTDTRGDRPLAKTRPLTAEVIGRAVRPETSETRPIRGAAVGMRSNQRPNDVSATPPAWLPNDGIPPSPESSDSFDKDPCSENITGVLGSSGLASSPPGGGDSPFGQGDALPQSPDRTEPGIIKGRRIGRRQNDDFNAKTGDLVVPSVEINEWIGQELSNVDEPLTEHLASMVRLVLPAAARPDLPMEDHLVSISEEELKDLRNEQRERAWNTFVELLDQGHSSIKQYAPYGLAMLRLNRELDESLKAAPNDRLVDVQADKIQMLRTLVEKSMAALITFGQTIAKMEQEIENCRSFDRELQKRSLQSVMYYGEGSREAQQPAQQNTKRRSARLAKGKH